MDSNQRLPPCQGDTLPTELRGQKRNGSISKKSLNSKQILTFREIPPKFYTRFRHDVKCRRNFAQNFTTMPKLRAKFYPATKFRNPTRNFITLARRSRVSLYLILLRFVLSSRFASPRLVSSTRLASPCIISPACLAPPCAWLRRPNFFIKP